MAFDPTNKDHLERLREIIRADPTLKGHGDAGRDNQVAPHFAADSGQKIDRASVPNADLLAAVYREGETWTAQEATELALLLVPAETPLSVDIRAKLDVLLADKPVGKAGYEAIRERPATVAEAEWGEGSTITTEHVSAALKTDRPDGKVER